ncbi:MAG: hypothetical protein ABI559_06005 [Chloroflexota bacterium]
MEDELKNELRTVVASMASPAAQREDTLRSAWVFKERLSRRIGDLWTMMATLDQNAYEFIRDPSWVAGFWTPEQAPLNNSAVSQPRAPRYDRGKRTLEIAAMLALGADSIHVSDITELLRSEGETLDERPLATSVGNFLTRSKKWRRIAPGEYALISGIKAA